MVISNYVNQNSNCTPNEGRQVVSDRRSTQVKYIKKQVYKPNTISQRNHAENNREKNHSKNKTIQ